MLMKWSRITIGWMMGLVLVVAVLLAVPRLVHEEWFWLTLVTLAVATVWFDVANRLYRSQWYSMEAGYETLDPDGPAIPPTVTRRIKAADYDLQALGFHLLGHLRKVGENSTNVTTILSIYGNACTNDIAKLVQVFGHRALSTALFFCTEYPDGTTFVTTDNRSTSRFPVRGIRPGSMSFPQIEDAARLWAVHAARRAEQGEPSTLPSDPMAYQTSISARTWQSWVADGFHVVDEANRRYRLSRKGAFLAALNCTPPLKQVRLALRLWRAQRSLIQLESIGKPEHASWPSSG
jgi:hypothetical protein